MAELIPLEYRVSVARRRLISRWVYAGAMVTLVCAGAVAYSYVWKRQTADALNAMQGQFQKNAVLLTEAQRLRASRDALANKMTRIERMQNDTVLLSLVKNVSSAFSDDDCLKYIRVDAHLGDFKSDNTKYQVQIRGITRDDSTHAELLDRLTAMGQKSQPPLKANLGEKHLVTVRNGEASFFDLTCEPPPSPVVSAKTN